jgi:hypothetical protein
MANASISSARPSSLLGSVLLLGLTVSAPAARAQYPPAPQIHKDGTTVLLEDYASPPLSNPRKNGVPVTSIDLHEQLNRVNCLRSEPADAPGSSSRSFVVDMNGTLFILDKTTKSFTPYINFADVFPNFAADVSITRGLISIAFDPNYAKNGKFYTVHMELPGRTSSAVPTNAHLPNLDLKGYETTPAVNPPGGPVPIEGVVIEWTDTNTKNATFEGTAREVLRIGFNPYGHLLDDLIFDPVARPGSQDYRNLYISVGDGGGGQTPGVTHTFPQQLNTLEGKILRITPDITLRPKDMLGSNGRYRIPSSGSDRNPFLSVHDARPEIYAYGFRNPHRMAWDKATNTFLVNDIGLSSWEEVDIVAKGGNYGWAEREGPEQLFTGQKVQTGRQQDPPVPFTDQDTLKVDGIAAPVVPLYPAAVYTHRDGRAIGSGFVYRGKLMPQLQGKYIFNDIVNGRLFYADLAEMFASHSVRNKPAQIHELQVVYKSPNDNSSQDAGKRRVYDIIADAYARKGGPSDMSGRTGDLDPEGVPFGARRADVRLAMDGDGELYVLSKSDGMIRKLTAVVAPSAISKSDSGH